MNRILLHLTTFLGCRANDGRFGRTLLSDKNATDDQPRPLPPYEENYWFNYYSLPGSEVVPGIQSGLTVTDKFDSGFNIVVRNSSPTLPCCFYPPVLSSFPWVFPV